MFPDAGWDETAYVDFQSAVAAARGCWGIDDLEERKAEALENGCVDEDFYDDTDNLEQCRQSFEDTGRWGARGVIIGSYNRSPRVKRVQLPLLKQPPI